MNANNHVHKLRSAYANSLASAIMVNTQLQYENEASTIGVVCVHLKNNSQRFFSAVAHIPNFKCTSQTVITWA